jgi:hypothetical protein
MYVSEVYRQPPSVWWMSMPLGLRRANSMRGEGQPGAQVIGHRPATTRREKQSMIVDRYSQLSQVRT